MQHTCSPSKPLLPERRSAKRTWRPQPTSSSSEKTLRSRFRTTQHLQQRSPSTHWNEKHSQWASETTSISCSTRAEPSSSPMMHLTSSPNPRKLSPMKCCWNPKCPTTHSFYGLRLHINTVFSSRKVSIKPMRIYGNKKTGAFGPSRFVVNPKSGEKEKIPSDPA